MGYCYNSASGRLACDACDTDEGVKKRRCPFGYCPADALCAACWTKNQDKLNKAAHRANGCERRHREYLAKQAHEAALLMTGHEIRWSALGDGNGSVHVLFRCGNGTTRGYYMAEATYDAIPLLVTATPDDYRKHGPLEDAPPDFHAGATTKQVDMRREA